MSIEIQKAMSAAWEYDHKEVASRGRLDDAYELGFIAAWQARGSKTLGPAAGAGGHSQGGGMSTLPDDQTKLGNAEAVAVKLRVGLDTLLNAASDLEAAMDGTTDEFNEELGELRKAIRIAANLIGKRDNREQHEDIE